MPRRWRDGVIWLLGMTLPLFTLLEVNLGLMLDSLRSLAAFSLLSLLLLVFLVPAHPTQGDRPWARVLDAVLALCVTVALGYIVAEGAALTNRAGQFTTTDHIIGLLVLIVVIECTRRSIGWTLPILSLLFILYALYGRGMPDWLYRHPGMSVWDLVEKTALDTSGVWSQPISVMFRYVFPFVVFGAFLEASGATGFIIHTANRLLGRTTAGPAKVAVVASGLLGSLSGSAVANAVTSGTFSIPMMRGAGFKRHHAAGVEAAASSGAALVPPIMGAGAYMMLEMVQPPVRLLQILQAAIIPAVLFYLSLFLLVHFMGKQVHASGQAQPASTQPMDRSLYWGGVIFLIALGTLVWLLIMGLTPYRAVTLALGVTLGLMALSPATNVRLWERAVPLGVWAVATGLFYLLMHRVPHVQPGWGNAMLVAIVAGMGAMVLIPGWRPLICKALADASRNGVGLTAAVLCVGILMGVVINTRIGTAMPAQILSLAQGSQLLAFVLIMVASLILGMGLPSAVSYLLVAMLIGSQLAQMGVEPLAAHMFVFYFTMMSMVTPPVALAAYATASIAGAPIMATSFAAFRFALVGFTLPFMFIYRPELLLLAPPGEEVTISNMVYAIAIAVVGITALASALSGYLLAPLTRWQRLLLFAAAGLALFPETRGWMGGLNLRPFDFAGVSLFGILALLSYRRGRALARQRSIAALDG